MMCAFELVFGIKFVEPGVGSLSIWKLGRLSSDVGVLLDHTGEDRNIH